MNSPLFDLMNSTRVINRLADTTVDKEELQRFLHHIPIRYTNAVLAKEYDYQIVLYHQDGVEWHLLQCLANQLATVDDLNVSVQKFMDYNPEEARLFINSLFSATEYTILTKEWYELLPLHQALRSHIEIEFNF